MILVYSTFPNSAEAKKMAKLLLEKKLIACANLVPGVQSLYLWEGDLREDSEVILLLKTQAQLFPEIQSLFLEQHPYQTPALLALKEIEAYSEFEKWIEESTK